MFADPKKFTHLVNGRTSLQATRHAASEPARAAARPASAEGPDDRSSSNAAPHSRHRFGFDLSAPPPPAARQARTRSSELASEPTRTRSSEPRTRLLLVLLVIAGDLAE